jgi:hypothetical protein
MSCATPSGRTSQRAKKGSIFRQIFFCVFRDLASTGSGGRKAASGSLGSALLELHACKGAYNQERTLASLVGCLWGVLTARWPRMQNARAQYEPVAWWFTRRRIGRSLSERYQVSKELPPDLLTLVRKLDALEGNKIIELAQRGVHDPDLLQTMALNELGRD